MRTSSFRKSSNRCWIMTAGNSFARLYKNISEWNVLALTRLPKESTFLWVSGLFAQILGFLSFRAIKLTTYALFHLFCRLRTPASSPTISIFSAWHKVKNHSNTHERNVTVWITRFCGFKLCCNLQKRSQRRDIAVGSKHRQFLRK